MFYIFSSILIEIPARSLWEISLQKKKKEKEHDI